MQSKATTVAKYLAELPEDRRSAISAMRKVVLKNLGKGYEEGMQYGMIGYFVPHSLYPEGYHCDPKQPLPFAGLASQKNHMAIYMMHIYADPELNRWFQEAWAKSGRKKLDMGKSCIQFKQIEDVPLDLIGEVIRRAPVTKYIALYESAFKSPGKGPTKKVAKKAPKTAKSSTTTKVAKKASAKKSAKKKSAKRS